MISGWLRRIRRFRRICRLVFAIVVELCCFIDIVYIVQLGILWIDTFSFNILWIT